MTPTPSELSQVPADQLPEWAKDIAKMPVQFEPLGDLVIIMPDPEKTIGEGGVVYASNTRNNMEVVGVALAVGPGKWSEFCNARMPMDVKVGERYTYPKFAGDDQLLNSSGRLVPYTGRVPKDHILVKMVRQTALLTRIKS